MGHFKDAKKELKRVDHQIYVSLKYTRTVDVLKNIVARFISSIDFVILGLLEKKEESGELLEMPMAFIQKVNEVKKLYPDKIIVDLMDLYVYFRKVNRVEYGATNEFRRHVTMSFSVNGKEDCLNIDKVTEYYKQLVEFFKYIEETHGAFDADDDE